MKELIRDTVLGHALRIATRNKVLPFEEERDPELWKRYIDKEKSGRMAHHGTTAEEEKEENAKDAERNDENGERQGVQDPRYRHNSRDSSDTRVASHDARRNEFSDVPLDPEKGKDVTIVTWYSDTDPEVYSS
jgi:DHA1 family multidrug resistance protein-like MFS transporter